MGKVRDKTEASKLAKPSKGTTSGGSSSSFRRQLVQFLTNLASPSLYKPMQGRYARGYTALALAVVLVLGLRQLFESLNDYATATRFGIPVLIGVIGGWVIFRLIQYPPFVEFLIATEAEMNKVSWTSKDDLYRATSVVLVTVTLMAVFLFGVDWIWSTLLQFLGVLKFGGGGAFGSTG